MLPTRRDLLRASAAGLLPALPVGASPAAPAFGRAKSVILLFLYGGASQLETFDVKPDAPPEVRGELGTIPTAVPGCRVNELLPRVASAVDRCTVIRSMTHPYPIHGTAYSVTSIPTLDTPLQDNPRDPRHWPFIGSVFDYLDGRGDPDARPAVPRNVALPFLHSSRRKHPIHNAGPYAAFLGRAYDPVWTEFDGDGFREMRYHFGGQVAAVDDPYGGIRPDARFVLGRADPTAPDATEQLDRRRALLGGLDRSRPALTTHDEVRGFDRHRELAFSLARSPHLRAALDLRREPAKVRERYGMTLFGQSCLAARRLVEAGGRFVSVFWDEYGSVNSAWDTHYWHFPRLKEQLLPGFDLAFAALLEDLDARGLLDQTLVVCTTEHGRTPKIDRDGDHPSGTGKGGRNHWSRAYSTVLAGAGVCRGKVVGRTDKVAGEVTENPVSPKDVLATAYHLGGIDPHATIPDRFGQPRPVGGDGRVLTETLR